MPKRSSPARLSGGAGSPGRRDAIFVSYRRSDSAEAVGRLVDDLRRHFGADHVFRDLDSNRPGQDYVAQIAEALDRSLVVLAVMGPNWAGRSSPEDGPRLCRPDDPVRLELEQAFAAGIPVIAVLVKGSEVPSSALLPSSLSRIPRLEMCRLRDADWPYDLLRLHEALRDHGVVPRPAGSQAVRPDVQAALTTVRRYERTLQVTRRRAYDAIVSAVRLLGYRGVEPVPEAAQVRFSTKGRKVTVKAVDAQKGHARVVVELDTLRGAVAGGGAAVLALAGAPLGLAGWAALRIWERRFATGLLDNVQRLTEGRGIGEDSSLAPGLERWRSRRREV